MKQGQEWVHDHDHDIHLYNIPQHSETASFMSVKTAHENTAKAQAWRQQFLRRRCCPSGCGLSIKSRPLYGILSPLGYMRLGNQGTEDVPLSVIPNDALGNFCFPYLNSTALHIPVPIEGIPLQGTQPGSH